MAEGTGDLSVVLVKNGQRMSNVYSSAGNYESGAISILFVLEKRGQSVDTTVWTWAYHECRIQLVHGLPDFYNDMYT